MKRTCEECCIEYDDVDHLTICPHEAFPMRTVVIKDGEVKVARSLRELSEMLGWPDPEDVVR